MRAAQIDQQIVKFVGRSAALTRKDAQDLPTPQWTLVAKFEGEFAPGSQTYAGTGTLRYCWRERSTLNLRCRLLALRVNSLPLCSLVALGAKADMSR